MFVDKVTIDCSRIRDWDSFHDEFSRAFGFFDGYGRNMDAWIDCMSCLDDSDSGMTEVHCKVGTMLMLELRGADDFAVRCPGLYEAIVEGHAFVNWRRAEQGEPPVLELIGR